MKFDPYYTWLAIPPNEQPPNHYRLLGVAPFEPNATVIEHAANRQMTHLRTFQSGKFAKWSQRLLNEVSQAKLCLLDPQKKAAYDSELHVALDHAADSGGITIPELPSAMLRRGVRKAGAGTRRGRRPGRGRSVPPAVVYAVIAGVCVAVIAFALGWQYINGPSANGTRPAATSK